MAFTLSIFLIGIVRPIAWSPPYPQRRNARSCLPEMRIRRPPSTILSATDDEGGRTIGPSEGGGGGRGDVKKGNDEDGNTTSVVYGVSYIGGDPCGSKYNDDPFDVDPTKSQSRPGLPDDMKDRIAALARAKMSQASEES